MMMVFLFFEVDDDEHEVVGGNTPMISCVLVNKTYEGRRRSRRQRINQ